MLSRDSWMRLWVQQEYSKYVCLQTLLDVITTWKSSRYFSNGISCARISSSVAWTLSLLGCQSKLGSYCYRLTYKTLALDFTNSWVALRALEYRVFFRDWNCVECAADIFDFCSIWKNETSLHTEAIYTKLISNGIDHICTFVGAI